MMKATLQCFTIIAIGFFLAEKEIHAFYPPIVATTRLLLWCSASINSCDHYSPQRQSTTQLFAVVEDEPERSTSVAADSSSPRDRPLLAALDLTSLLVFAAVGKASHATAVSDGSLDLFAVAITAAPFVASWFLTAPLTGVYQRLEQHKTGTSGGTTTKQVAIASLVQTAKGWAVAVPLGCAIRGVIKGYVPPVPFVIVTLIVTLVLLGGTRALYAVIQDKRSLQSNLRFESSLNIPVKD
jgi:Protein of unknown function (DUF3054)